jgi:CO/xanthine dehydrogenase Mo-binding subunit
MIGQRVRRREDPRFLTGNGRYVDDLELPGALPGVQVLTAAMPANGEQVWRDPGRPRAVA